MRFFLALIVCKILRFSGKLLGKGSSLPGQVALKICPDVLSRVKVSDTVIAVTGSNGKTSTVEMISHVLKSAGKSIVYNKEGSNQIEGICALILSDCDFSGKMKSDILLIETDERYAKYVFEYFSPTFYVITNLYRDQLTRNGHPERVFNAIKQSIKPESRLFLNADDPLVSLFGQNNEKVVWFGMDKQIFSATANDGVYDDFKYCPVCGKKLEYEWYHFNHIGSFHCTSCSYKRKQTDYTVNEARLSDGVITVNGSEKIALALKSVYNVYNVLACFAVCASLGIDKKLICESINDYVLTNGRVTNYMLGSAKGTLLTSKHENSISYDSSLRYIVGTGEKHAVMIIVDSVSRKYFTSDTSWIWDINFNILNNENTRRVYLCGKYAHDLAVRFSFTDIGKNKISVIEDIGEAVRLADKAGHTRLFTVTCFSDKEKFLSAIERRTSK